jgi:hypothetical protein
MVSLRLSAKIALIFYKYLYNKNVSIIMAKYNFNIVNEDFDFGKAAK